MTCAVLGLMAAGLLSMADAATQTPEAALAAFVTAVEQSEVAQAQALVAAPSDIFDEVLASIMATQLAYHVRETRVEAGRAEVVVDLTSVALEEAGRVFAAVATAGVLSDEDEATRNERLRRRISALEQTTAPMVLFFVRDDGRWRLSAENEAFLEIFTIRVQP